MKVEQQVEKRVKLSTKLLKIIMVILAVLFLLLAIMFETGYMLFCFIFAGMYFYFEIKAKRSYEYSFEGDKFSITVILGNRKRILAHVIDMTGLEVIAPHDHEAVAMYRKDGGSIKLPKYDYTSYDDKVKYYTMIAYEDKCKTKYLLDLNEDMLNAIRMKYPNKVHLN